MFSTYRPEDVTILLKDISGLVTPLSTPERERLIQSGVHYSEMLPVEYEPTEQYLRTYHTALRRYGQMTADAVAQAAEQIWAEKGPEGVLVSLARAGTPAGILIRRFLRQFHGADLPHYTISIIRGRGIDKNAMSYILARHKPADLQFVDGWTGKGAIQSQLREAMRDYPGVSPGLAVLSDPACAAEKYGTRDDFLIASSCLNSTVSGLLSRTFLRGDIIGADDFHGTVFYENLRDKDLTYQFIKEIADRFRKPEQCNTASPEKWGAGLEEVREICHTFGINDVNLVKPGTGEATRVLLRRVPWKILVRSLDDGEHLGHIFQLAREKQVEVVEYPLRRYRACGLIRKLADT
ncbi:MAG: cysteine protease StiP family protein [Oscillospiraceae bacterium]|nr:cysteine protease StiP family protein [Oscillospiraceae bacterium]